jgi:hypothetical protein
LKLSELNKFAAQYFKDEDPDIILQLEDDGCMRYTGVIRAGIYVTASQTRLINLLPASALIRQ